MPLNDFLRFETIVYPLWRREMPTLARPFWDSILRRYFPVDIDRNPPHEAEAMAQYLHDWDIIPIADSETLKRGLANSTAQITPTNIQKPEPYGGSPVRIPAQWEPMEKVLISWCIIYPSIWEMHAQMAEAISQVAEVEILVPMTMWANAVWLYLTWREKAKMENIHFSILPTNDIWIRDYGPVVGIGDDGERVSINAIYDPLPQYPQQHDNGMPARWSAHHEIPVKQLKLHTEGGNLWSDGQGTLLMSEQIFYSNPYYTRDTLLDYLHTIFDFEKLIITPRLRLEETGHIDLLIKLASADTVFVSSPKSLTTGSLLRNAKKLMQRETNSRGQSYNVVELPTPPLYLNWFLYTIRRAYTNSLTINGRVLVPTFDIPQDDVALRIYEETMPDYEIMPINCRVAINGGGAVHCMTKEVPKVGM